MNTRSLLFLLINLLYTLPVLAQVPAEPNGQVQLTIRDAISGKGIEGVNLSVVSKTEKEPLKLQSDSNGLISFEYPIGKVKLVVKKDGYDEFFDHLIIRSSGVTKQIIELIRIEIPRAEVAEAESVSEMYMYSPMAISKDAAVSSKKSKKGLAGLMPAGSSGEVGLGYTKKSGQMTAGQLNDFGKWRLWSDIKDGALAEYQDAWAISPHYRYSVLARNKDDFPVVGAQVYLLGKGGTIIWETRTDNTGQAELWNGLYGPESDVRRIEIEVDGERFPIKSPVLFDQGVNLARIDAPCGATNSVDIAFIVDATGSMGDEIAYLKAELKDVMERALKEHPDRAIRLGSIFYRDHSDSYVTRRSPLSAQLDNTIDFIKKRSAGGGGDFPEAIDVALDEAVNSLDWDEEARARLAFIILDAPPHGQPENIERIQKAVRKAAEKGIRLIPVSASGIDKSTEYLLRSMALATNGTYTFLTDHSGIGGSHIAPTTDSYDVELLNDLLLRLIDEYTFVPDCKRQEETPADTLEVLSRQIIKHEILNDEWVVQYSDSHIVRYDTTDFLPIDEQFPSDDTTQAVLPLNPESALFSMRIYPNPVFDQMTIQFEGRARELHLTDLSGKILRRFADPGPQIEISMIEYPVGQYLVIALSGEEKISGKVMVVH